jgi:glycerol-3-phosphate acyltransferase PlsY
MKLLYTIFRIGIVNYLFGNKLISEKTGVVLYETDYVFIIPALILVLLAGYLLGSFNFATYISKKKYKDDIREHGSGNAGMTNMMRTYGKKAAALTLLGDAMKAVIAVIIGYVVLGIDGAYVAGIGSMIGHTWPLYYNFKGGKGVVTAIVTILCTNFWVGLILLLLFVCIVWATKYISFGSIMGGLMYPILLHNFGAIKSPVTLVCSFLLTALIIFNHRSNIKRLYEGKENKFSFKKSKPEVK